MPYLELLSGVLCVLLTKANCARPRLDALELTPSPLISGNGKILGAAACLAFLIAQHAWLYPSIQVWFDDSIGFWRGIVDKYGLSVIFLSSF
jgi:hypothetical protein